MLATTLEGRPVVACDTGEALAEVKDVVFSATSAVVDGFTLRRRGLLGGPMKGVLAWADVRALGPDALMLETVDDLRLDLEARGESARADVIGDEVVTDDGRALGTVTDVVLMVTSRLVEVVGYQVRGADKRAMSLVPMAQTGAVSGTTLVVPASVERFVRDDLAGFGTAVDEFRATHDGAGA